MNSTHKSLRQQLRLIHILASAILGIYLYSPWHTSHTLRLAMTFAILPILTLTGLWMWQGHKITKWLKPQKTPSAVNNS
ncbi:hypothetical protein [Gloeothece verrucosa]|uniref:Uncharacterized protein n=1 Tax=Gloeothece verrucosa (strain PCC 7822) TaxID=497965 RepID=E0UL63_GLOV7|nr:hypothetical protein [Gloeothece verrucosa]ADN17693.1 hypothetical protein Cyan7822_5839 [Gloeothece verrucosa PCC 7822]